MAANADPAIPEPIMAMSYSLFIVFLDESISRYQFALVKYITKGSIYAFVMQNGCISVLERGATPIEIGV